MSRKQDRFEAMVEKEAMAACRRGGESGQLNHTTITKLLRREHASLVRAVRRLDIPDGAIVPPDWIDGYRTALKNVLALLATRKGRKG